MSDIGKVKHKGNPYGIKDTYARNELLKKIPVPDSAEVGQAIIVTEVDSDNKPISWVPVNTLYEGKDGNWWLGNENSGLPATFEFGSRKYSLIEEVVLEESVTEFDYSGLNLDSLFVLAEIAFENDDPNDSTKRSVWVSHNGMRPSSTGIAIILGIRNQGSYYAFQIEGLCGATLLKQYSSTSQYNALNESTRIRKMWPFDGVQSFTIYCPYEGYKISAGSNICIYGIERGNA